MNACNLESPAANCNPVTSLNRPVCRACITVQPQYPTHSNLAKLVDFPDILRTQSAGQTGYPRAVRFRGAAHTSSGRCLLLYQSRTVEKIGYRHPIYPTDCP